MTDDQDDAVRSPEELARVLAAELARGAADVASTDPAEVARVLADAVLASGWRPPPRLVATPEELEALPPDALVVDRDDAPWIRQPDGRWAEPSRFGIDTAELVTYAPVRVVDEPPSDGTDEPRPPGND